MTTTEPTAAACLLSGVLCQSRQIWRDWRLPVPRRRNGEVAEVYAQLRRALDELEADLATYPLPAPENAPTARETAVVGIPEDEQA